jgi:CheY-like chemotaxis protein
MSGGSKKELIIIADDDSDDRLLMKDALHEVGFAGQVKFVENGLELIDCLNTCSASPGLVLLDLQMPRMSGHEVLSHLKSDARLRYIPVVVHSTSSAEQDISFCYKTGASSYVVKPQSYDELLENMRAVVNYWFKVATLPPCSGAAFRAGPSQ